VVRVRYVIAGVVAAAWIVGFGVVETHPSSLLQFIGVFIGMLIFGAIAWPDDFRRHPPTGRDGPPGA
jgi:hypothetical protein